MVLQSVAGLQLKVTELSLPHQSLIEDQHLYKLGTFKDLAAILRMMRTTQSKQDSDKLGKRSSSIKSNQACMAEIKDLFDLFDQDHNGVVTKDEILRTFTSLRLPITELHAEKLIKEFDTNGDDELEFMEFVSLIKKYLSDTDYPTQGMFKYFDRDGDGYITLDEFVKSMRCVGVHISEKEASEVVPKYYTPGTNKMDYNNFNKLMKNLML